MVKARPDVQAGFLKIYHGETIIQMVHRIGIQAAESLVWRDEQDALSPCHLHIGPREPVKMFAWPTSAFVGSWRIIFRHLLILLFRQHAN